MTTSRHPEHTTATLCVAMELSQKTWKLAFATAVGQKPRRRDIAAGAVAQLQAEIARAKQRLELPADAPVHCCYEAGRDGFWIHRQLLALGIENLVVDSSSIEVSRRHRRVKTDRVDVERLLAMLLRWHQGEKQVWRIVVPPSEAEEDARRLHRELEVLRREQTAHAGRLKSLLATVGVGWPHVTRRFPEELSRVKQWDGKPLPTGLRQQLLREFARMQLANRQIRELEQQRAEQIRQSRADRGVEMVRRLMQIRGLGANSSWLFVRELFGWRTVRNRRELASLVGLTPTPYNSGTSQREQGISRAGNRRLRTTLVEIAWGWLRFQPHSRLTCWYQERFGGGSKRQRRIGIVALARKLLIVLWKYLQDGEVTDGFEWTEAPPAISYTASLT
jgi:transposase